MGEDTDSTLDAEGTVAAIELFGSTAGRESAIAKSCVAGSKISKPKGKRKGHPHVFRLDLAEADNGGGTKYIVSVGSADSLQAWKAALGGDIKDRMKRWKKSSAYQGSKLIENRGLLPMRVPSDMFVIFPAMQTSESNCCTDLSRVLFDPFLTPHCATEPHRRGRDHKGLLGPVP